MDVQQDIRLEAPDAVVSGLLAVQDAARLVLNGNEVRPLPSCPGGWYLLAADGNAVWVTAGSRSVVLAFPQAAAFSADAALSLLAQQNCELTLLLLTGEAPDRLLKETAARGGLFFPMGGDAVRAVLQSLSGLRREEGTISAPAASAEAYRLLTRLYGAGRSWDRQAAPIPRVVADAMALMPREYAFLDGVGELAARLEVSQEYLTRAFRKHAGVTPGKYLNRLRVERAKLLLRQEGRSVTFVSDACGFSNGNYFARVFRQFTGMNPGEYVRAMKDAALPPDDLPGSFYVI